jgi:LacI family transcriptional regulator
MVKPEDTTPPSPDVKKAPDIREVARRAGVSISTVSRFLNHKTVSPPAEAAIEVAVRELGYLPNRIARSLKLKRTMTIGMVIPDISNPFFPELVKGVESSARAAGFHLVLTSSGEEQAGEWERLEMLYSLRCDGCIVVPTPKGAGDEDHRARLAKLPIPLVFVDRMPGFEAETVLSDNFRGGVEAVKHLLRLGHTRIAALDVMYEVGIHRQRVEGYRRALQEAGIEPDPRYSVRAAPTVADGFSAMVRLLELEPRPSAVFSTANRLTIGALSALYARGLRCPEDISIVSYDDYEWQEAFLPRLTTIAQPAYLMGQRAAEMLCDRLLGKRSGPPEQVVLASRLVVRESCGIYSARSAAR